MALLHLLTSMCILGLTVGQLDYPNPRIVIVGPTGAGKSSLANALLGCDPRGKSCVFAVCGGMNSCTKETSIGTGPWLGTGPNFTVVDTPGFGDSDGQDNKLIEEMIKILDEDLGYTNIILLLFDGLTARFTTGLHNMLRQMSSLFGEAWWDNMVIGVSKWKYSQDAIDQRQYDCDEYGDPSDDCKNEAWFMREISGQLKDKFNLDRNFTFAFIHSHSQSGKRALNDAIQQEYYQAQAEILWDAATTWDSKFEFKTIDDVLEENELLKKKYRKLNFLFETNIATLYSLVRENKEKINGNGDKILISEQTLMEQTKAVKGELKTAVDKILINEQDITINKRVIKSSVDKIKGDLKNAVDETVEYERRININVEKINTMKEDLKGAVNRINGNEKGIQGNAFHIESNMENINGIRGEIKEAVNRIIGNEVGINRYIYEINIMKGNLKDAVDRIDGNEARILANEKGINSNTVNTNRMKGELKNAVDRIDGNGAKILSNEKAITAHGLGIKGNLEKANTMKGHIEKAVGRIVVNERKIQSNEQAIKTNEKGIQSNMEKMKGELISAVDNLKLAPIGTIIAWVNRPEKRKGEVISIPDGWQRCDGGTIQSPSKWAGLLTPNLNGEKRFLRGGSDRNVLTMEEQQMQNHEHTIRDPGHSHAYDDKYPNYDVNEDGYSGPRGADYSNDRWDKSRRRTTFTGYTRITVKGVKSSYGLQTVYRGTETRPKNMNVIYIMRIY